MDANFGVIDNRFLAKSLGLLNPHHPITLPATDPVRSALEIFQRHKIGCVVLTDAAGKIAGIFSERDVVLKVCLKDVDIAQTELSSVMTANPQTAEMTTTIAYTLNMMSQGGYRHMPIIDEERYPVGLVSVKDIIDFIAQTITKDLQNVS